LLAIPAALLLGIMRAGETQMAFEADVAPEIIDVILAIILLLVCAPIVVRWLLRLRRPRDEGATIQLTSGWGG
jgi:simple sugar transport system permease protein